MQVEGIDVIATGDGIDVATDIGLCVDEGVVAITPDEEVGGSTAVERIVAGSGLDVEEFDAVGLESLSIDGEILLQVADGIV